MSCSYILSHNQRPKIRLLRERQRLFCHSNNANLHSTPNRREHFTSTHTHTIHNDSAGVYCVAREHNLWRVRSCALARPAAAASSQRVACLCLQPQNHSTRLCRLRWTIWSTTRTRPHIKHNNTHDNHTFRGHIIDSSSNSERGTYFCDMWKFVVGFLTPEPRSDTFEWRWHCRRVDVTYGNDVQTAIIIRRMCENPFS